MGRLVLVLSECWSKKSIRPGKELTAFAVYTQIGKETSRISIEYLEQLLLSGYRRGRTLSSKSEILSELSIE